MSATDQLASYISAFSTQDVGTTRFSYPAPSLSARQITTCPTFPDLPVRPDIADPLRTDPSFCSFRAPPAAKPVPKREQPISFKSYICMTQVQHRTRGNPAYDDSDSDSDEAEAAPEIKLSAKELIATEYKKRLFSAAANVRSAGLVKQSPMYSVFLPPKLAVAVPLRDAGEKENEASLSSTKKKKMVSVAVSPIRFPQPSVKEEAEISRASDLSSSSSPALSLHRGKESASREGFRDVSNYSVQRVAGAEEIPQEEASTGKFNLGSEQSPRPSATPIRQLSAGRYSYKKETAPGEKYRRVRDIIDDFCDNSTVTKLQIQAENIATQVSPANKSQVDASTQAEYETAQPSRRSQTIFDPAVYEAAKERILSSPTRPKIVTSMQTSAQKPPRLTCESASELTVSHPVPPQSELRTIYTGVGTLSLVPKTAKKLFKEQGQVTSPKPPKKPQLSILSATVEVSLDPPEKAAAVPAGNSDRCATIEEASEENDVSKPKIRSDSKEREASAKHIQRAIRRFLSRKRVVAKPFPICATQQQQNIVVRVEPGSTKSAGPQNFITQSTATKCSRYKYRPEAASAAAGTETKQYESLRSLMKELQGSGGNVLDNSSMDVSSSISAAGPDISSSSLMSNSEVQQFSSVLSLSPSEVKRTGAEEVSMSQDENDDNSISI